MIDETVLSALLSALQSLAGKNSVLDQQDWRSIASEALTGSAPAQYIVATAFEKLGNFTEALAWYEKSAAQGHLPALSKLEKLGPRGAA